MANFITCIRIFCSLALIPCSVFSKWFYVLYILGGISDALDGFAARHMGKETKFGADFDTVADIVFSVIVIVKVVQIVSFSVWMVVWIIGIAAIKCINIAVGFVSYKKFLSEHTVMNKICGAFLLAIPLCIGILPRKIVTILIVLTCTMATFAAVQEGHYIRKGKEVR